MIDPEKFERLAKAMHDASKAAEAAKSALVRAEENVREARRNADNAENALHGYVAECAKTGELPKNRLFAGVA